MSQVTIYLEEDSLAAAKAAAAAARAKLSLSQWFAQFAAEEKKRQSQDWPTFFAELDSMQAVEDDDFPSLESLRGSDVPHLPRESW